MTRPSIGTDPEFFLVRDGQIVPACGLVGGTKGRPRRLPGLSSGFGAQEDNVMVELNIPPCNNAESFVDRMEAVKRAVIDLLGPQYSLHTTNWYDFSHEQLEHPQAQEVGCSPEYSAYEQGGVAPAMSLSELSTPNGGLRFCGGHIHIGYTIPYDLPKFVVAAFCDLFVGLPSLSCDKQGRRREFYGKAGRFRPTPYGIEYRTLSNFWTSDEGAMYQVARRTFNLASFVTNTDKKKLRDTYQEIPWAEVRRAIETENEVLAADVISFASRDLDIEGVTL